MTYLSRDGHPKSTSGSYEYEYSAADVMKLAEEGKGMPPKPARLHGEGRQAMLAADR